MRNIILIWIGLVHSHEVNGRADPNCPYGLPECWYDDNLKFFLEITILILFVMTFASMKLSNALRYVIQLILIVYMPASELKSLA